MFIRQEHEFPVSWSVSGIYEEDCCCGHVIPLHLFVCFQQVVIKIINPVLFVSITCQKGQLLLLFSPNQMLAAIGGTIGFSFLPQDNHCFSILEKRIMPASAVDWVTRLSCSILFLFHVHLTKQINLVNQSKWEACLESMI